MNNLSQILRFGSDGQSATFEHMDGYADDIHIKKNYTSGTSNFSVPTAYSTPINSTVLLIQSKSQSNNSTTFTDYSGTANSYGTDVSGQNNHFTTVSGMDHRDQLTDSPTNNFPTLNSLIYYPFTGEIYTTTFRNGSLGLYTGGAQHEPSIHTTMAIPTSGKWYCEILQQTGGNDALIGIRGTQPGIISPIAKDNPGKSPDGYALYGNSSNGNLVHDNAYVSYGTLIGYTNGDVISVAVDMDNNKIYWAKNGTWINSANPGSGSNGHTILAASATRMGHYFFAIGDYDANSYAFDCNFGQDPTMHGEKAAGTYSDSEGLGAFQYAVPTGFKTLCAKNLPEPGCTPSENFKTITYTGDGGLDVTGVGFQPDLVWCKARGATYNHQLHDSVRGATEGMLSSNQSSGAQSSYQFDSFDSDGFTTDSGNVTGINGNGDTQVAWNWKMNGSGSSNSNGSTTSTVSANTAAGQSIVTYSGSSGNDTVGHGLSQAPNLVIVKARSNADQWRVGSIQSIDSMDFTDYLRLNDAGDKTDESTTWNDTAPTSTVFSVGTDSATNHPGYTYVAYCFHNVEGYSKIGSYSGNGSSDGTFVYCGFRPQWLLLKPSNYGDGGKLWDTTRGAQNGPYNQYPPGDLKPNTNAQENFSTAFNFDFLSNGFKWRATDNSVNGGYNYLYYAIAEQPFKFSNAR